MKSPARTAFRAAFVGAFAITLAACQAEEPNVEPDAEDLSGGELITTPVDAEGVDVNLPETEMTNVPVDDRAQDSDAVMPAEEGEAAE